MAKKQPLPPDPPTLTLEVGKSYLIESVARMWVGRVESIDGPYTVTLVEASWVADTGRLHQFVAQGPTAQTEVEPVGVVGVQWVAWVPWPHPLPTEAR